MVNYCPSILDSLPEILEPGYYARFVVIQELAKKNKEHKKILEILAGICSLRIEPTDLNSAYNCFHLRNEKDTFHIKSITDSEINFFIKYIDQINDPWIKARISDLIWVLKKQYKFALLAINTYFSIEINQNNWIADGELCFARAITLSCSFNLDIIKDVTDRLIKIMLKVEVEDCLWILDPLEYLKRIRKKIHNLDQLDIAKGLEALGNKFIDKSRNFYEESCYWYKESKELEKVSELKSKIAEIYETESKNFPLPFFHIQRAIKSLREIPTAYRNKYETTQRIKRLEISLLSLGKDALEKNTQEYFILDKIQVPKVHEIPDNNFIEALKILINIQTPKLQELQESSKNINTKCIFSLVSSDISIASDGRVTNIISSREKFDRSEKACKKELIDQYLLYINIIVQAHILPTLREIYYKYIRVPEDIFIKIAKYSPLVPDDQEEQVGKALFDGYKSDFVRTGILPVLFENMVRNQLKYLKVKTFHNNEKDNTQTEKNLSSLLELHECKDLFGIDLHFEMGALFTEEGLGVNARHSSAHGMHFDENLKGNYSIYIWWWILRLVLHNYLIINC